MKILLIVMVLLMLAAAADAQVGQIGPVTLFFRPSVATGCQPYQNFATAPYENFATPPYQTGC